MQYRSETSSYKGDDSSLDVTECLEKLQVILENRETKSVPITGKHSEEFQMEFAQHIEKYQALSKQLTNLEDQLSSVLAENSTLSSQLSLAIKKLESQKALLGNKSTLLAQLQTKYDVVSIKLQ